MAAFRFALQASQRRIPRCLAGPGAQDRGPRLLDPLRARPPRRPVGADGRAHRGGGGHDDAAGRHPRARQRLPPPGGPGQGGGHPRRRHRRPLRVRHRRRLDDHRLRAVGHPDGAAVGARGPPGREPRDHARACGTTGAPRSTASTTGDRGARAPRRRSRRGPAAGHRRRRPAHPHAGRPVRRHRQHRAEPRRRATSGPRWRPSRWWRSTPSGCAGPARRRGSAPTTRVPVLDGRRCRSSRTPTRSSSRWRRCSASRPTSCAPRRSR